MKSRDEEVIMIVLHQLTKAMRALEEQVDTIHENLELQKQFNDQCISAMRMSAKAAVSGSESCQWLGEKVKIVEENCRIREEENLECANALSERMYGVETRLKDIERAYLR